MIQIYIDTSHSSSRKAIQWLIDHNLEFEEHRIDQLEMDDFYKILSLTERGIDDILAIRGQAYHQLKIDPSIKVKEFLKIIKKAPSLLKKPLIFNDSYLLVGYNEDEIRTFLTSKYRKLERNIIVQSKENIIFKSN